MEQIFSYESGVLYDAKEDVMLLLRRVTSKFLEGTFELGAHASYIRCKYSGSAFPWLFYSELDKAVRMWCTKEGDSGFIARGY